MRQTTVGAAAAPTRSAAAATNRLIHLFDDVPALVGRLRAQLTLDGRLYLAGLVGETRRARWYLKTLHRAGEVAVPRTGAQLYVALGRPADSTTSGCMAYATLPPA